MIFVIILVLTLNNVLAFDLRGFRANPEFIADEWSSGGDTFPYLVCISFQQQHFLKRSLCSGSLIGNEWILTAAHCAMNAIKGRVYLGAATGSTGEVIYTVTENDIIIHPDWDSSTGNNDISLIKIPYISYSASIQAVQLPSASSFYANYNGDNVIAPGWQHESSTFSSSKSKLKWTALQVSPRKTCSTFDDAPAIYNTICAVAQQRDSACSTDAGGPLVLESSKIQIGLNILREPAGCSDTYSAVYTRVADYLDWIKTHTGISY